MNGRPLVTMSMMTYNQERYVVEAVRGMLSQTYEPLEIIISDDHSTDRTWEIVQSEISRYLKSGGKHTNIVLSRNDENMGIIRHCQKVQKMAHGVFRVGNGCDDISLPNRVERIVEVWASRPEMTCLMHGGRKISITGKDLGPIRPKHGIHDPLGAVSVYFDRFMEGWPEILDAGCYEDWIFSRRAMMTGEVVEIDDELLLYRVGSGVSSSMRRAKIVKNLNAMAKTCRQVVLDIESRVGVLPQSKYQEMLRENQKKIEGVDTLRKMYGGHLKERWRELKGHMFASFKTIGFLRPGPYLDLLEYGSLLLPLGSLDFIPNFFMWLGGKRRSRNGVC